jgi:hypothetical protein
MDEPTPPAEGRDETADMLDTAIERLERIATVCAQHGYGTDGGKGPVESWLEAKLEQCCTMDGPCDELDRETVARALRLSYEVKWNEYHTNDDDWMPNADRFLAALAEARK